MNWYWVFLLPLASWACETLPLEKNDYMLTSAGKAYPAPSAARITLSLPRVVTIGQAIPSALVVSNAGPASFGISVGGDYRSTGFPLRLKVHVRNAFRQLSPPLPQDVFGFGGGGLGFTRVVAPGGSQRIEFSLENYVSFLQPGFYTVTAGHDLGWSLSAEHPQPLGVAWVLVREPSADEAAAYVRGIFEAQPQSAPGDEAVRLWQESKLEGKLCVLRHPVYLQVLQEYAQAGSVSAVQGIGHIAVPAATDALLALLEHASPAVVEEALVQLCRRLPPFPGTLKLILRGRSWSPFQIDPLYPAAWLMRHEQPLLEHAARLLSAPQPSLVDRAATLLHLRGYQRHAPSLLRALEGAMSSYRLPEPGCAPSSLDLPSPQLQLVQALDALRHRGWRVGSGGNMAEMVAHFRELADARVPHKERQPWRDSDLTWLTNGPPLCRASALQAVPQPLTDAAAQEVLKALEDRDLYVLRTACEVAGKSARPEFARPLAQVLESSGDSHLQAAAHDAALACGARMELWEALAATIIHKERLADAIAKLINGTLALPRTHSSGNTNFTRDQRFQIRDAWRAFLHQHQRQISAGKKVPAPKGKVAQMLTGAALGNFYPAAVVKFPDGSRWPPQVSKK